MSFCQSMSENIGVTISFVNRHTDKNKHQTDWMELDAKTQTTIGARVKQARTQARLTQVALAKKTGIKQSTVSDLERGENMKSAYIAQIAHACGVSPLWLATGRGDMAAVQKEDEMQLSDEEFRLIGLFRSLPADFRHHIMTNAVQIFDLFTELPDQAKSAFMEPGRSDEKVSAFADKKRKGSKNEA